MRQFKIAFVFLSIISFLHGCRKSDHPNIPDLIRVPIPLMTKDGGADAIISAQNPGAFSGKFIVDLYFKTGVRPQKFDIVIMKNGNPSNVKLFQENVTSFPATITITGQQLITLFGNISVNDQFDIGADVTIESGEKFEAFPTVGIGYGTNVNTQPGNSLIVRYTAVCKYDAAVFNGNFVVVADQWADYSTGNVVPVTMIDATHFSFQYLPSDPRPIIVTVNPNTNAVSVAKQVYGSGYPPGWTLGDLFVESSPSVENIVAPCDKTVSVLLNHSVASGTFPGGPFKIVLRKQ